MKYHWARIIELHQFIYLRCLLSQLQDSLHLPFSRGPTMGICWQRWTNQNRMHLQKPLLQWSKIWGPMPKSLWVKIRVLTNTSGPLPLPSTKAYSNLLSSKFCLSRPLSEIGQQWCHTELLCLQALVALNFAAEGTIWI